MKLQTLLTSLRAAQTDKTAGETGATAAAPAATETKLAAALRDAATAPVKTAAAVEAAPSAVEAVTKIAAELAQAEQGAAIKEAALLGAAFADATVARFAEWQKAAGELPAAVTGVAGMKVASVAPQADEVFSKYAEENPVLARQAVALGYSPTAAGLEKMAEDSYVQGYNDQVTEIHKTAADEFLKAAAMTNALIEQSLR